MTTIVEELPVVETKTEPVFPELLRAIEILKEREHVGMAMGQAYDPITGGVCLMEAIRMAQTGTDPDPFSPSCHSVAMTPAGFALREAVGMPIWKWSDSRWFAATYPSEFFVFLVGLITRRKKAKRRFYDETYETLERVAYGA